MTVSVQGNKSKHTISDVKNERFIFGLDKTMCTFSAFDKATNGQTDMKHEMW